MRVAIARALFVYPSLLLLDEPTNHVDLEAVMWLSSYLATEWKKTLLVVSHDQSFLNEVVQEVIHLDRHRLYYYKGDFDFFRHQPAQRARVEARTWAQHDKAIKALKRTGKYSAKEAEAKVMHTHHISTGSLSCIHITSEMRTTNKPREYSVTFQFPDPPPLAAGGGVLQMRDVSFGYRTSLDAAAAAGGGGTGDVAEKPKMLFKGEVKVDEKYYYIIHEIRGVGCDNLMSGAWICAKWDA